MKVLHLLDHSLPVQSGYAYRSDAILRALQARGIETVQLTGPKHNPGEATPTSLESGMDYQRCPMVDGDGVMNQLGCVRAARRALRQLIRDSNPDIVHAHSPCLNGLAALNLGAKVVYEMRSSWEDAAVSSGKTVEGSLRYRLSRALETFVVGRADATVVICEGLKADLVDRRVPAQRISVVGNAIDPNTLPVADAPAISELRTRLNLDHKTILGFFGTFFAWEGLDLLLEALPQVVRSVPDVALVLAGGGEEEPRLREMVRARQLESCVHFAGRIPHQEIPAYYGLADLMIFPRRRSRLTEMVTPLKPLEAMHLGSIVIASDVGGHRELIRDGQTGYLFAADSAEALSGAIIAAVDNRCNWSNMHQRAHDYVQRERTWTSMAERYETVYRRALR